MCEKHSLPLAHPLLGTWPITQACALNGNQTGNLQVHRPVLNALSDTSQGCRWGFNNQVSFEVWSRLAVPGIFHRNC